MNGQSLKKILQRAKTKLEVNRREFLKVLATATAAVTGVAGFGTLCKGGWCKVLYGLSQSS
jgi:hypothetical protein